MNDASQKPESGESASAAEKLRQAQAERNGNEDAESFLWEGSYSSRAMTGHWIALAAVTLFLLIAWIAISALVALLSIRAAWVALRL